VCTTPGAALPLRGIRTGSVGGRQGANNGAHNTEPALLNGELVIVGVTEGDARDTIKLVEHLFETLYVAKQLADAQQLGMAYLWGKPLETQAVEHSGAGGFTFELIVAPPGKALEAGDERRSLPREVNGNGQSLPAGFRELPEGELLE